MKIYKETWYETEYQKHGEKYRIMAPWDTKEEVREHLKKIKPIAKKITITKITHLVIYEYDKD